MNWLHALLETLLAVSTVPPMTTNFIPSTIEDEPPRAPPTRGCTRNFKASIEAFTKEQDTDDDGRGTGRLCLGWGEEMEGKESERVSWVQL